MPPAPMPDATAAAAPAPEAAPAAPAPSPPTSITGFIETGYHLNLRQVSAPNAMRVYDTPTNSFLLHSASVQLAHAFSPDVSAVINLDAGTDAAVTNNTGGYVGPGGTYAFDVREAYAKYSHSGFSLTAGKFVTYEGIEVIQGPLNPTLTRGYLFGFAEAFTHIGAKAHYNIDNKADIGVGVVNGWDKWVDDNDWKTLIFRAGITPTDTFFAALSGSYGSEQGTASMASHKNSNGRLSLDLTGGVIAGDFTLNFQGNFGTEKNVAPGVNDTWWGLGLQPVYKKDQFSFGGRVELFGDKNGSRTAPGGIMGKSTLLNITLTPGVTLAEHFTTRLEYRADIALAGAGGPGSKNLFNGKSTQHTIGLGAHYIF
jgi:hypothetical protein